MDDFNADHTKMVTFGRWLTELSAQKDLELYATCGTVERPIDVIRLKYGQSEATKFILEAFVELFQGELEAFKKSRFVDYKEENDTVDDSAT